MKTSFYVLMGILIYLIVFNLVNAKNQKPSKARSFGIWLNAMALAMIATAVIIAVCLN